jgi:hypothetical protein
LTSHEQYIRDNFERKIEVKRNLTILKLVSFLVPLLISLKKKMKIPDVNNLLPSMSGEDVHTEREFPPQTIGADFKSKTFSHQSLTNNTLYRENSFNNLNNNNNSTNNNNNLENNSSLEGSNLLTNELNKNSYFSLHGGIQFELETCEINKNCNE